MKVEKTRLEKNVAELKIEVEAEQFEAAMEKSYRKNVSKIFVQGFRKGKAPRKMIEKIYGEGVFYEDAMEFVFQDTYPAAVKEENLNPVDRPEVDIKEIGSGKNFVYTAKVTLMPEAELGEYIGIKVDKIEYPVTDEDVDNEIKNMMERASRMVEKEDRVIENGDIAMIDFEGFVDGVAFEGGKGENHSLTIGSGQFIPGFEEQLVGKKSGDETDVNVKFPDEYHSEELKGKDATFKVKVNAVKIKEYPELDDDFAKDVSEFDSLEELKAETKKRLTENNQNREQTEIENSVIDKVIENATVEIPDCMVEQEIDDMMRDTEYRMSMQGLKLEQYLQYTGMTVEAMRDSMKENAKKRVTTLVVLRAVANKEDITMSDEDIEAEYKEMAEKYKMEVDKLKEALGEGNKERIIEDLRIKKTVQKIISSAEIK